MSYGLSYWMCSLPRSAWPTGALTFSAKAITSALGTLDAPAAEDRHLLRGVHELDQTRQFLVAGTDGGPIQRNREFGAGQGSAAPAA